MTSQKMKRVVQQDDVLSSRMIFLGLVADFMARQKDERVIFGLEQPAEPRYKEEVVSFGATRECKDLKVLTHEREAGSLTELESAPAECYGFSPGGGFGPEPEGLPEPFNIFGVAQGPKEIDLSLHLHCLLLIREIMTVKQKEMIKNEFNLGEPGPSRSGQFATVEATLWLGTD